MKTFVPLLALVLSTPASATCFYTEEGRLINCDYRSAIKPGDGEPQPKQGGSPPTKNDGRGSSDQTPNRTESDDDRNDSNGDGEPIIIYQPPQGGGSEGDSYDGGDQE